MTPKLTPQEIDQIDREAEIEYPDIRIEERGSVELWEMHEFNDMQAYKREAYAAALRSERLKHRAEIQAYREFLQFVVADRKHNNVSKEMMAVFAENLIVRFQQTLNQFK